MSQSATRPLVGYAGVLAFVVLSGLAVTAGLWKVLTIGWVAFVAMAGAAIPGKRAAASKHAGRLVWGYGLAAGAMVTSAAVFLLPQAFGFDPKIGGFGVAAGILLGFASHTVGHRLAHYDLPFDATTAHLTAHSLTAGLIIGVVYAALPELGLLLGLAIVSHKGPAGYAAARRLATNGKSTSVILLPAAGVGITAILSGLVALPESATLNAAVFGFAAGIFLHIAMDFLPRCEVGGEVGEVAKLTDDAHALLDRLRIHAVVSTSIGAFAVFGAWLVVA
ncbi:ZIP family metal transporter [Haladaptatus sp. DYSN1]|uniref:ZIP family metal transporter n=1 Tax=unclassified Haladaptatus TaxID=2622732 RepID=UPI00240669CE|nr:ZIP family metal transporter [Haladaptatus sp. DYSN1]